MFKSFKFAAFLAVLELSTLLPGQQAQAQSVGIWSIVGAGCVPTGQTSATRANFNVAGDVGFASGVTGDIILTCPVPSYVAGATHLSVTYRDTDGGGNTVNIVATLRRKDLRTGSVSDVGGRVDTNAGPVVSAYDMMNAQLGQDCEGGIGLDHNQYAYYVQINMKRSAAQATALLASVTLRSIVC
ncbi:MAG: hypothetical protein WAU15_03320 [Nitrosomonas sp.]